MHLTYITGCSETSISETNLSAPVVLTGVFKLLLQKLSNPRHQPLAILQR